MAPKPNHRNRPLTAEEREINRWLTLDEIRFFNLHTDVVGPAVFVVLFVLWAVAGLAYLWGREYLIAAFDVALLWTVGVLVWVIVVRVKAARIWAEFDKRRTRGRF